VFVQFKAAVLPSSTENKGYGERTPDIFYFLCLF